MGFHHIGKTAMLGPLCTVINKSKFHNLISLLELALMLGVCTEHSEDAMPYLITFPMALFT